MKSSPFCLDPYDLREGFTCDTSYTPLISSWQDCKAAAESFGFTGDKVAHVDYKNPAWGTNRPRGCFQAHSNRFHFNEAAGGGSTNGTWGPDKILCIRKDLGILLDPCGTYQPLLIENSTHGYIESPNYPSRYPDTLKCNLN